MLAIATVNVRFLQAVTMALSVTIGLSVTMDSILLNIFCIVTWLLHI